MGNKANRPLRYGSGEKQQLIGHDSELAQIAVNNNNGSVTYLGRAKVGSAESDAVWQIQEITYDSTTGAFKQRKWAQNSDSVATSDYEHIWDNSSSKTVTGVTQANPVVVTANAHGFSNGDKVILENIGGTVEVEFNNSSDNIYTVANKTANDFELSGVDGSGHTAYTTGGTVSKTDWANHTYS